MTGVDKLQEGSPVTVQFDQGQPATAAGGRSGGQPGGNSGGKKQ
jgi:hypothetical protein